MAEDRSIHIPIISDILKRPIERGNVLVGFYDPSAQWVSLILTMISELVSRGYAVGMTTLGTAPAEIRRRLSLTLPNLKEHEAAKRFTIIDWYTWMTGRKSTESRFVDSLGLAQFNVQDSRMQREDSPLYDFLAADNHSAFLKYNDERAYMQWLDKTLARMKELKGVRLYGFMKRFHSDAFYSNLETTADGVIELDNREKGKRLENMVRLRSMKGIQHPTEWRRLEMTRTGAMRLASSRS